MKKPGIILIGLVVIVGLISFYILNDSGDTRPAGSSNPSKIAAGNIQSGVAMEEKTNDEGSAQITVQPEDLLKNNVAWDFYVTLNTHSIDLIEDLTQVSVLLDENGERHVPLGWEGDPPGGHHRKGVLKFKALVPLPNEITLVIQEVGGTKERKFTWQIKG